jgi:aldehyde:ferredoxin oxidoreductase
VFRSPLSGAIADAGVGGDFPLQLKAAGLDAIVVTGESPRQVVLAIQGETARLEPASALWGKSTSSTLAALDGKGAAIVIGPAGEQRLPLAQLCASGRVGFGRAGLGAVLGSKGLKAITVAGDGINRPAYPERFAHALGDVLRLLRASPALMGEFGLQSHGTAAFIDLARERRMTPTRNFRATHFPESTGVAGPALRKHTKGVACAECPVGCQRLRTDGVPLPHYDALSHFGALLGIADRDAILAACDACAELGLDPVSTAATLAAWGEARGRFPDGPDLVPAIQAMVAGDPEGLSLGARAFCSTNQRPDLDMTVKGLEIPAFDPRGAYGLALAYAVCPGGASYEHAYPIAHELLRKPVPTDRFSFAGKARMIVLAENALAAVDSLSACKLAMLGASLEEYGELLSATTGLEYPSHALEAIGERIVLTTRFYNAQNGFTADADELPGRFFAEPGSGGDGIQVPAIDRALFLAERGRYYHLRGLDPLGGFPEANFLGRQP